MAEYNGLRLTTSGRALLAKALAGTALHFTRVGVGDGALPAGTEIRTLTGLVHPLRDLPITGCRATGAGEAEITCLLTNEGLTLGYWAREVGLFAQDPDLGEVLYAYTNAGELADYIPAAGGADLVSMLLTIVTVVDQAANVTATINGNLAFVTHEELRISLEDLFRPPSQPIEGFWVHKTADGNVLRKATLPEAQRAILGGDVAAIPNLRSRTEHLERLWASHALLFDAQGQYPDYDAAVAETFDDPDQVDLASATVTSVVSGDDSLEMESLQGLIIGLNYTLTDGIEEEQVRLKTLAVAGDARRAILEAPVTKQYLTGRARLYRSSALVSGGTARGAGTTLTQGWAPGITWRGTEANAATVRTLPTAQGAAGAFDISGDIAFAGEFATLG